MTYCVLSFSATIQKIRSNVRGVFNPCVRVPKQVVSQLLKDAGRQNPPIQVIGTVNAAHIVANVVRYAGAYRLYLNGAMRRRAKADVGDVVQVSLVFDPAQRTPSVPRELKSALAKNPRALTAWRKLPPCRRKEILSYLNSLKTKESLARNIEKTIRLLTG